MITHDPGQHNLEVLHLIALKPRCSTLASPFELARLLTLDQDPCSAVSNLDLVNLILNTHYCRAGI